MEPTLGGNLWNLPESLIISSSFYLRAEVAFLHLDAPACLYGFGYLLYRGEEDEQADGCQHTAVYLTDGRSDETADDEKEAGDEGDVECTHGDNG